MATSWEREIEEDIAKRRIKASKLKSKSPKNIKSSKLNFEFAKKKN